MVENIRKSAELQEETKDIKIEELDIINMEEYYIIGNEIKTGGFSTVYNV